MKLRPLHLIPVAALLLTLTSCSKSGLVNAKGRLTYKGKAVPSTHVFFWPEQEGKRRSTGLTDDSGNFTLSYSRTEPGVLVGKHTVFVKYYVSVEEELHQIPPKASNELKEVLAKYGDPQTSPLHFEITSNGQFIEIA